MVERADIRHLMVGDDNRDSTLINGLLTQIHSILCEREGLSSYIIYDLSERAARDKHRWQRLLSYPGPDAATLQLLEDRAEEWTQNPATFWNRQLPNDFGGLPPIAQIIACFLQTESDNAWSTMVQRCSCILLLAWEKQTGPAKATLAFVAPYLTCLLGTSRMPMAQDIEKLAATVDRMVTMGSRYLNLERSLTAGITLCLGNSVSESSWSKHLPKSGPKHDAVIEQIKNTSVSGIAPKYKELRSQLVEYQLRTLQRMNYMISSDPLHVSPEVLPVSCAPTHNMGNALKFTPDVMDLWTCNTDYTVREVGE